LLLAARKRARLLAAPLAQARKVAVHALEIALDVLAVAPGIGAEPEVLFGAEVEEGAAAVGNVRYAHAHDVLGGAAVDALARETDFALRAHHRAQCAQGRGLARA